MSHKNNRAKGFTLIEALAAMSLIAFIVTAGFSFYPYYKKSLIRADVKFTALNFARETMELLCWQTTPPDVTSGEVESPLPAEAGLLSSPKVKNAKRTYKVTSDPSGNYRIITTTVSWDS